MIALLNERFAAMEAQQRLVIDGLEAAIRAAGDARASTAAGTIAPTVVRTRTDPVELLEAVVATRLVLEYYVTTKDAPAHAARLIKDSPYQSMYAAWRDEGAARDFLIDFSHVVASGYGQRERR